MCLVEIRILQSRKYSMMIGNNIFCFFICVPSLFFYVAFHTAAGFIIPIIREGRTRR